MPAEKILQFPAPAPAKRNKKATRRADGRIMRQFRYTDMYGVTRRKAVYGRTLAEAEQKKREFLAAVDMALRLDEQDKTVAQWVDEWLLVHKKPHVTVRTYTTYDKDARLIKEAIGPRPLKSVTLSQLQAIVNARKGLSASAIRKTAMTIRAIFKAAVVDRLIAFDPSLGLLTIKGTSGSHRVLSEEEIEAVTAVCAALDIKTRQPHRYANAAMLMLYAGLRKGEAAAFNFSTDVDAAREYLTVSRASSWPSNQAEIKTPKSDAGGRVIPIFAPLLPYVQGEGLAIEGVRHPGRYVSETAFNDAHADFVRLCGVSFTPHDLRHTFCTFLYDAGVDVKTAQLWMGHDDPTVTMRIYTHLSKTRKQQSENAATEFFSKLSGSQIGSQIENETPKS